VLGLSKDEIDARYNDIIAFADIGDFIEQPVKTYSSGMSVRLAFAVHANVDADILIIDEALAVGDVLFQQKCMRFLRDFKENGAVLFVSHNAGTVINLCDRAVWLEKGQVQAIATAKDVCQQYFTRRYQPDISSESKPGDNNESANDSDYPVSPDDQLSRYRDMRMAFINNSNLRNDIQVFEFSSVTKNFGNSGATIVYAGLEDLDGKKLSWMVGGEMARIVVEATVLVECKNIIIGFNLKDKLGQVLFAQNTYLDTYLTPISAKPGDAVEAIFTFRLPILPIGNYAVDVAIADGAPKDSVQLQWAHDVFVLESQVSSVMCGSGLIGLSFDGIELRNKRLGVANGP
jgi:lipopolysaccharide transport system ATP-binding protein